LVVANASVKSVVPREQLFQPALSPTEHLERVFVENPAEATPAPDGALAASPGGAERASPASFKDEPSSTASEAQLRIPKPGSGARLSGKLCRPANSGAEARHGRVGDCRG